MNAAHERATGEIAVITARKEAIERFRATSRHWLINSDRCMAGGEPFPFPSQVSYPQASGGEADSEPGPAMKPLVWGSARVENH